MKKILFSSLFLLITATIFAESLPVVTIVNNIGKEIIAVVGGPTDADDWEDFEIIDYNHRRNTLSFQLLEPLSKVNRYDIIIATDDNELYFKEDVRITRNTQITFNRRDHTGLNLADFVDLSDLEDKEPAQPQQPASTVQPASASQQKREELLNEAKALLGIPYRSPSSPPSNFDCSSFVSYVFSKLGYTVPRASSAYSTTGKVIEWKDAEPGDVLIFAQSAGSSRIDHVAILYKKSAAGTLAGSWIIHSASVNTGTSFKQGNAVSKTGVVITELGLRGDGRIENEYFYQRYMQTTRILD